MNVVLKNNPVMGLYVMGMFKSGVFTVFENMYQISLEGRSNSTAGYRSFSSLPCVP